MIEAKNIIIILAVVALIGVGGWYALRTPEKPLMEESLSEDVDELIIREEVSQELVEVLSRVEGISSLKYDIEITGPEMQTSMKYWQKQGKIRMEAVVEQQEMVNLVNINERTAYIYLPKHGIATKVDLFYMEDAIQSSIKEQAESLLDYNPVVIGSAMVEGKDCLIIQYTQEEHDIKMWIWKDYGLPIKSEIVGEEGLIIFQIKNIELVDIPDSVFELPPGVPVTEIPI